MEMSGKEWKLMEELAVEGSEYVFWQGLNVWIKRPHILNKRLCVVNELVSWRLERPDFSREPSWESLATKLRNVQLVPEPSVSEIHVSENEKRIEGVLTSSKIMHSKHGVQYDLDSMNLRLRQHLPKRSSKHKCVFEVILQDPNAFAFVFIPMSHRCSSADKGLIPVMPLLTYAIRYVSGRIQFLVFDSESSGSCDASWLITKVFPKICHWINEIAKGPISDRRMLPSLNLVSKMRYSLLYNDLKLKYSNHFIKIWPERTDPTKFVYQIIAVASYLIVLWEEEREKWELTAKQSFVDLGCGNGLLTHILCMEGHSGIGIDVKRRKIWDLYGPETKLLEQPIVPSSRNLFPEYDWIIGSHSDELTPWIPVIAARSSRKTSFFLLPCCAYNFNAKFQRRNSKVSIYEDYMNFIEEVARTCFFDTRKDKLRIPSTKRICIVGSPKPCSDGEWLEIDGNLNGFINRMSSTCKDDDLFETIGENHTNTVEGNWVTNFQARNPVQEVRNCTRLNAELKSFIVKTAVDALLEVDKDATEIIPITDQEQRMWHKGGRLELADLAAKIPKDCLQKLKSEFGGLQTLLRNHYHIFGVNQTKVTLRNYKAETPFPRKRKPVKERTTNASTAKTKQCWFDENHPDGCPLTTENCYFIHRVNPSKDGVVLIQVKDQQLINDCEK